MEPVGVAAVALASALAGAMAGAAALRLSARQAAARERAAAARLVESAPVGLWYLDGPRGRRWMNPGAAALLGLAEGGDAAPAVVLALIEPTDRRTLSEDIDALLGEGRPFERRVATADGSRHFHLTGRRVADDSVIWFVDWAETARLTAEVESVTSRLRARTGVIDALPWPVWWRDPAADPLLAGCNRAYAALMETDPHRVLAEAIELGGARGVDLARRAARTGVAQSESLHVVSGGERRLIDLTESPNSQDPGGLVGYARDVSAIEAMQETLGEHIAAHGEVLERLGAAIAIYAADRRMTFYNSAFVSMWGLPPDRLDQSPLLGEVLEMKRERRVLPEMVDFPAFKRQRDRLFTSLIEPQEELLHLPDERTVRLSVSPHPQGGLLFVYEDVTDRVALERSHNTLTAVQRLTLDSLYEGVAVFGTDGRLRLFNDAFARLFSLEPAWLARQPHVGEIADASRMQLPDVGDWEREKSRIVLAVSEPKARQGRMDTKDGRTIDFAYVPLPDGQCLLLYFDVTDTVRVERALKERNAALENADLLKSQFISSISYELRSPLNAILGFTELLREELFGPLNDRQREQVGHIHAASQDLAGLINDVLDLAALQAGYLAIERRPAALRSLLDETVSGASGDVERRGVILDYHVDGSLGTVVGDERRLRQAIGRVLSSAIAYTPAGAHVAVSGGSEEGEDAARITITDPGHGLVASDGLFEPSGARQEPAGRMTGAGVGLALCKNIIELHGGVLTVEMATEDEVGRITMLLPTRGVDDEGPGKGRGSAARSRDDQPPAGAGRPAPRSIARATRGSAPVAANVNSGPDDHT
ncbi:PAS-domain containing protein [Marivibrio halodurans]|uniref:histidine kinase n=1 Tax=Marivibrio halodurans TaxID=2039722 RepID=A0A8J7V421_9PROT|nr:PAS-domain containing protein [Marivibrio halodurans]MBP5858627.1 PAS-domain containing protein [Marivibrio halodurans]